jgi:hypothetical protein
MFGLDTDWRKLSLFEGLLVYKRLKSPVGATNRSSLKSLKTLKALTMLAELQRYP